MEIKFNCSNPACRQRISVDEALAGRLLHCPICKKEQDFHAAGVFDTWRVGAGDRILLPVLQAGQAAVVAHYTGGGGFVDLPRWSGQFECTWWFLGVFSRSRGPIFDFRRLCRRAVIRWDFFGSIGSILSLMVIKAKGLAPRSSPVMQKDKLLKTRCFFARRMSSFLPMRSAKKCPAHIAKWMSP